MGSGGETLFAATRGMHRVVSEIIAGSRAARRQGTQKSWFTDALWELCWRKEPGGRPHLQTILRCLQDARQPAKPISGADRDIPADTEPKLNRTVNESGMLSSPSSVPAVDYHFGANKIPWKSGEVIITNSPFR